MCEVNNLREERAVWYWKRKENLGDSSAWNTYEDIDNEIIESAYLQREKQVSIDGYLIDLERFIQQHVHARNEQKPETEIIVMRSLTRKPLHRTSDYQKERFAGRRVPVTVFSETLARNYSPFLKTWAEKHKHQTSHHIAIPLFKTFQNCYNIQYNIYLAHDGIIQEGKKIGKECQARWIAGQLMNVDRKESSADYIPQQNKQWTNVRDSDPDNFKCSGAIGACCAWLYSRDSFLFRLLNETLRCEDTSRVATLGPFIYLLECFNSPSLNTSDLILYRGELLEENMKQCYQKAVGTLRSWLGFTSTSKNRQVAEIFGNTLFIITFHERAGYSVTRDISRVSQYPTEEEVLLRSGVIFMIDKTEMDHTNTKYLIYLNIRE